MRDLEIGYDKETWYYDAIILSEWIVTQAKSLDELVKNLSEAFSLSNNKTFSLNDFNISFDENYVNI